jgi:hypothetical protein
MTAVSTVISQYRRIKLASLPPTCLPIIAIPAYGRETIPPRLIPS